MTNDEILFELNRISGLVEILNKRIDAMASSQGFIEQRHKYLEQQNTNTFQLAHAAHNGNVALTKIYDDLGARIKQNSDDILTNAHNVLGLANESKKFLAAIERAYGQPPPSPLKKIE